MATLLPRPADAKSTAGRWPVRAALVASACALVLHLLWLEFLAGTGGDLAAQDAWTGFARLHPFSAYDFAWYGGMHPASYSIISPYVMSVLGVRGTMIVVGTLSAGLVAVLLGRLRSVTHPIWPSIYAAVALTGNAASGRVTFGLGVLFALGALTAVFVWRPHPDRRPEAWSRAAAIALLAGLATASSPVAGLFLGLVAAALWLRGRRRVSLTLGVAPILVVLATAVLFPFFGTQPISWRTAVVPLVLAVAGWALVPRGWRLGRICCAVYAVAVGLVWVVPSPIGTNVSRLALLFGGVLLVAAASGAWWTSAVAARWGRSVARLLLVAAILTATGWQAFIVSRDLIGSASAATFDPDIESLVTQLQDRGADLGRVEVVPTKSHREASALAPHVNLARGWNRQADVARNPMFYRDDEPVTASEYHRWLKLWGVRFVVLPISTPDYSGLEERELVRSGLPFLRRVWSDATWTLYEVDDPTPMASTPGELLRWGEAGVTVRMPSAGSTVLRIAWSPWLSIVDAQGRRIGDDGLAGACLGQVPSKELRPVPWVVLRVTQPGTYRIGAPYSVPRGTPCPDTSTG
jgi:hypothetical protein